MAPPKDPTPTAAADAAAPGLADVLKMLAEGQAKLSAAVESLVKAQAAAVERPKTHAETYPDGKVPVPAEFKGKKTYRLKAPHYRGGKRYEIGERITVTDEIPSKTWVLIDPNAKAPEAQPVDLSTPAKRASDEQV